MIKVFDFRCSSCDRKFEAFVKADTETQRCVCSGTAYKVVSPTRSVLDPIKGHFPSATDKWAKHHEQAARVSTD